MKKLGHSLEVLLQARITPLSSSVNGIVVFGNYIQITKRKRIRFIIYVNISTWNRIICKRIRQAPLIRLIASSRLVTRWLFILIIWSPLRSSPWRLARLSWSIYLFSNEIIHQWKMIFFHYLLNINIRRWFRCDTITKS